MDLVSEMLQWLSAAAAASVPIRPSAQAACPP